MKRNIMFGIMAICVIAVISFVGVTQGASAYVPLEALWNRVADASSDDASIRVEFANTVSDFTVKNETALTEGAGAVFTIKTGNTQTVTIDTEGAETIDGGATYVLDANYEAVTLTTDGTNFFVLSGYLE
jgi:hypothetical protein